TPFRHRLLEAGRHLGSARGKTQPNGRFPANTGAYLFPREVFDIELKLSARGEYEITDYVSALAARGPVQVIQAKFWLPIVTTEVWQKAQEMDLTPLKR